MSENEQSQGNSRRRLHNVVLVLLALGGLAAFGSWGAFLAPPSGEERPALRFEVPRGASAGQIAMQLEERGLIRSELGFRVLLRLSGEGGDLRAGEFPISPSMSAPEVLEALTEGPVWLHRITLPEGWTAREYAARLEAEGLGSARRYVELAYDPVFARSLGVEADSLEGYLFPSTYSLAKPVEEAEVLRKMVETLRENLPPDWKAGLEGKSLDSLHELLTLASIVEKETGTPVERPVIAGVFLNRLRKGMRLETDPTVIYGLGPDFEGNLTRAHLREHTPYNTYRIRGLPPGPIANPGLDAIRAVLDPAETDYLFFVSRQDGSHYFSEDYETHTRAVRYYQLRRGAPPPGDAEQVREIGNHQP